jgi:hypothetical protein
MDTRQEKLQQQVSALLKQRKDENEALQKIITAIKSKELNAVKENKSRK